MKIKKIILLLTIASVLAVSTVGCSFTSAKVDDAIMTQSVDEEGVPGDEVVSFPADASILYTSAKLYNAPDHTSVRIVWTYVTGDEKIDEVTLDSGTISNRYIYSYVEPQGLIPQGDYKVEYYIEDREEPDAIVKFVILPAADTAADTTVEPMEGAYLEDVYMTTNVSEDGYPVDTVTIMPPTGTWYVSAILRNAQPDTIIHFVWYDTTGTVIDEYDFDPEGETDIYIFGTLVLNQIAPEGQYLVEIYIDGADEPAGAVNFTVAAIAEEDAETDADYSLYSQTEGKFSIMYPSDWMKEAFPENLAAGFYPLGYDVPGQEDVNTVVVVSLPGYAAGYSIDDAIASWIDETEAEELENYVFVDQGTDTVNGNDVAFCGYSWSNEGYNLNTMDFLIINGDDLYVITFTGTEDDFNTLYPYVEQMVLSFKVL